MASTRGALAYTLSSQYLVLAVQFVATIFIARLLTPEEIGIFSIGAAFVTLAHILRDFGSGQYIIQEKDLTTERIRAAFTTTLLVGWSMGGLLLAISPLAANFYDQPGIESVLSLLSLNFFLIPFSSVTLAYLQRQMNFKPAAVAGIGSALVSTTVSVSLAYLGFGYMSLAWGGVASTASTILLVSIFRPKGFPILPGFAEIRRVLSFGGRMSAITILDRIAALTPELTLGKTQGFHEVGLYSRTQGTISIFTPLVMVGISPVVAPLFAHKKKQQENLRLPYRYGVICVTGVAWLFFANLAVLADPFILALYGDQWGEITPYVQLWCISALIYHLISLADQVLIGTGNVNRLLRVSAILSPYQIIAFAGTAAISLDAVFLVILTTPWLRLLLLWNDIKKVTGTSLRDHFYIARLSGIPAASSAAAAALCAYLLRQADVHNAILTLLSSGVAAGVVWLVAGYAIRHPLIDEIVRATRKVLSLPGTYQPRHRAEDDGAQPK